MDNADGERVRKSGAAPSISTAGLASGDQMTGWSSAERPGSAGKSQPPAVQGIIRKGKMPRTLRYEFIEAGLIGSIAAQAFPGDALDGQRIVEFILVLISPAGCIRLHCSAPG